MIKIINLRNYKINPKEILIKVDRSSVLGNPYKMDEYSNPQREYVCDLYEDRFNKIIDKNISDDDLNKFYSKKINRKEILKKLDQIVKLEKNYNIALGCWCYPKRCHAETIRDYILKENSYE